MAGQTTVRLGQERTDRLTAHHESTGASRKWIVSTALDQYLDSVDKSAEIVSKASKAVAVVDNSTADKVIDYLNSQAGTGYRHTDTNRKLINARLKDYTKRDVFDVITKKCAEWKDGSKARYLRPSTLFKASRFEEYLNQDIREDGSTHGQESQEFKDWVGQSDVIDGGDCERIG